MSNTSPPVAGAPTQNEAQDSLDTFMQTAATATGNGAVAATDGYNGCQMVEVVNTGSAAATVNLEGSYDGVNWYAVGYQRVDGQASPARAATGITAGATSTQVFQVLDLYPQLRARISALAAGASVSARLYAVPV